MCAIQTYDNILPSLARSVRSARNLIICSIVLIIGASCNKNEVPARVSGRVLWADTGERPVGAVLFVGRTARPGLVGGAIDRDEEVPIAADGSYEYVVPEFVTGDNPTETFGFLVEINPDGGVPDTVYSCFDFPIPSDLDEINLCDLDAKGEYEIDLLLRR